jgi:hypothetical protein
MIVIRAGKLRQYRLLTWHHSHDRCEWRGSGIDFLSDDSSEGLRNGPLRRAAGMLAGKSRIRPGRVITPGGGHPDELSFIL